MITHDARWSLPRGNTLVPSRWQATPRASGFSAGGSLSLQPAESQAAGYGT